MDIYSPVYGECSGKHFNETQHQSNNSSSLQDQKPRVKPKQGRKSCHVKGFPEFLKPIWINRKPLEESHSAVYSIYSALKEGTLQLFEIGPPLNKKGTRPIHNNFNFNQAFPRMKKKKKVINKIEPNSEIESFLISRYFAKVN